MLHEKRRHIFDGTKQKTVWNKQKLDTLESPMGPRNGNFLPVFPPPNLSFSVSLSVTFPAIVGYFAREAASRTVPSLSQVESSDIAALAQNTFEWRPTPAKKKGPPDPKIEKTLASAVTRPPRLDIIRKASEGAMVSPDKTSQKNVRPKSLQEGRRLVKTPI